MILSLEWWCERFYFWWWLDLTRDTVKTFTITSYLQDSSSFSNAPLQTNNSLTQLLVKDYLFSTYYMQDTKISWLCQNENTSHQPQRMQDTRFYSMISCWWSQNRTDYTIVASWHDTTQLRQDWMHGLCIFLLEQSCAWNLQSAVVCWYRLSPWNLIQMCTMFFSGSLGRLSGWGLVPWWVRPVFCDPLFCGLAWTWSSRDSKRLHILEWGRFMEWVFFSWWIFP
jgi:hypothetical protein